MKAAIEELKVIFGPVEEGYTTTAQVLNLPATATKDLASQSIEQLDLDPIMRDIGAIAAREIANELQAMALRPADYVDLPDMPKIVASRIAGELVAAPPLFVQSLIEQLKLRG